MTNIYKTILIKIVLILMGFSNSFAQSNKQISDFLNAYFKNVEPIIYSHADILPSLKEDFISIINEDTLYTTTGDKYLVLTNKEKIIIVNKIKKYDKKFLNSNTLPNSKYLTNKETHINKDSILEFDIIWRKYKKGLHGLTKPIFIRENSICIFYYQYSTNTYNLKSYMHVLRKNGGNWEKWLTIYFSYT